MLIGICGSVCAGKTTVQNYLITSHNFTPLKILNDHDTSNPPPPKAGSQNTNGTLTFASASDLLDYVTQHWTQNFVTTSISSEATVDTLSHRPLFILVHIDAPLLTRFARWLTLLPPNRPTNLETFLQTSERTPHILASLATRARLKLHNTAPTLRSLHHSLSALNLPDPSRLRPTWDAYFMTLASLAARRSNCMRRQVGCVLVRANRVLSTGYNGTPRHLLNCAEGGCARCNNASSAGGGAALSTCLCLHAEENALLEAGRERIEPGGGGGGGGGAVLYCNTCPCLTCSIKIVQVGIAEVVFSQSYYMDEAAAGIFREAGVKLRQFSPLREGLVVLGGGGGEEEARMEDGGLLEVAAAAAATAAS